MEDFDQIYADYYSEVYKFVLSLCQNHSLAEEITQESFFKALKSIDSFNGNCKISTWLLHTAVSSGSWCGGQRQQCGDSGSGLR